ncbi:hypothetical protein, partial [Salmonella enterica]|uniref:hypothetical protein n=1 Tax=Salmonella enterica TaxID=28901 RepID=UPI002A74CE06
MRNSLERGRVFARAGDGGSGDLSPFRKWNERLGGGYRREHRLPLLVCQHLEVAESCATVWKEDAYSPAPATAE